LFDPVHTPDLKPEDFFVALAGERVVGCLALWDQHRFKQTVVRGYAGALGRWRPVVNLGARLGGWPDLPPPNAPFHFAFASHFAVDNDQPAVFAALLRAVYCEAAANGYSYFMLGLADGSSGLKLVRATYRYIDYPSRLYLVAWPDEPGPLARLDDRLPGVEIAVL
jgi:hypothetical protein